MIFKMESPQKCAAIKWLSYFLLLLLLLKHTKSSEKCIPRPLQTHGASLNMSDAICFCDSFDDLNGWSYTCLENSNFEVLFSLQYITDNSLTFQCATNEPDYASLFQMIDLNRTQTFIFKSCPLPNFSYDEILPVNEKRPLEQIKIENKQGNQTFTPDLFNNISESMTSLILNNNEIEELPETMFANFPLLRYLSLSDNKLKSLPDKIFFNLSNLVVLELANNQLESFHASIFQNLLLLEKLYLYKNRLKRLPANLFENLVKLKVLDLADNQLILLPDAIFHGLSSLTSIRLRGNWLGILPEQLFGNSTDLQEIDLSLNRFMEPLPERLLYGLQILENVSIHDCNLTHIHENFFAHCPKITHLKLQNNGLTSLPENIFKNNTKIKEIDLNFNSISLLPRKLLPNQQNLEKFYFYENTLSVIPDGFFEHARYIKTLVLGRNRIQNAGQAIFRDLPFLESVDLSKNNLSSFSLSQNENIRYIDLSYNNFKEMPSINWQHHLRIENVNLEHNKITYLSIPLLYSNRRPSLNVAFNNIKAVNVDDIYLNDIIISQLKPEVVDTYTQTRVSLNGNPFNCDCKLYKFFDYIKKSNEGHTKSVQFATVQNLTCNDPQHMTGKQIIRLSPDDFICDLKEKCPSPCNCHIRAVDDATVVNCSNHRLKSLPISVPYNTSILFFQRNLLSRMEGFNNKIWENLTELYLENNLIMELDNFKIPQKLTAIFLRGNRLTHLAPSLMNFSSNVKEFHLTLSDNPWVCNCPSMNFKKWLAEHYQIVSDVKKIMCANRIKQNNTLVRMPILTIPDEVMCPINDWPYKVQLISVTTICVVLALLLFIVSVLYYRNKQTVIAYVYIHMHNVFMCFFNEEDIDEDKIFDAFVSYSSSDRDVALKLIEELEKKEPRFKLCIHERNWIAGYQISWNIFNSVHNSRRTILVVSKEFLESMWFQVEFRTAYYQMLEDKIDRLIIIVKGELPPKGTLDKDLQYLLTTKTYLVWEEKWFWEKLRYAMPHKRQKALQNDVMALKDRPDREKVKPIDNQIAILSSGGTKTTDKVQEVVQNGTNRALSLVNKETPFKRY